VSAGTKIDGRTARSQRTRTAIIDAVLELLHGGDVHPSIEDIAARAGVSQRSIFQHFGDRESVLAAVGERHAERVRELWRRVPRDGPFAERLDAFLDQRVRLLEYITPVRRSALLSEPFSPVTRQGLERIRALKRREAEQVFAPELGGLPASERPATRAALGAAASWATWESLRAHQGLSVPEAAAAVRRTIAALCLHVGGTTACARWPTPTT